MWEVWWTAGNGSIGNETAVLMDSFEARLFAEGHGVAIVRQRGGTVVLAHVVNAGTDFEYTTYWLLIDPTARNGAGSYRQIGMASTPRQEINRRKHNALESDFTPGAIEL